MTPGFLLLLAVLFWMDKGMELLGWGLLACAAHELGHYCAGRALGGRLERLELTAVGASMRLRGAVPFSYGQELLLALAGPAVNLGLGWAAAAAGNYLLAGLSFCLGFFNLLPILPLDGGRILWCALSALLDADWAERILTVTAGLLVGVLAGAGGILAVGYANFTLLITALWLLGAVLAKKHEGI